MGTSDNHGYWLVGADGGVFALGDAVSEGSLPGLGISVSNVVGIAGYGTAGYWLAGSTGAVYSFNVPYRGGANGTTQHPIVGIATTWVHEGYWEVATDGGVFAYTATSKGSAGATAKTGSVVAMAAVY